MARILPVVAARMSFSSIARFLAFALESDLDAEDGRQCSDILKLSFEDNAEGGNIVFTIGDVALCVDCWLVGGKGEVLFSVRHRDNLRFAN